MKKFALIVAGGKGARMQATIPKQFLKIAGKPVLLWTIQRFLDFDPEINVVLVLPADQFEHWTHICEEYQFQYPVELVEGGSTRFQSVKNGLQKIGEPGIVFIHDGVRPLVSLATLTNCYQTALEQGNALPVVPIMESVRKIGSDESRHVDRSKFRLVQTPQTFQTAMIKRAYEQPEKAFFTDDASVCEADGQKINLVGGNVENLKLTNPIDLKIAEALLKM